MAELQESDYGEGRDYVYGSPHLQHRRLTERIEADLDRLVKKQIASSGQCRVVEVGAGHGTFTNALLGSGASVTVTEMSEPSVRVLTSKFQGNEHVTVVHDVDGSSAINSVRAGCDLIVFVSVLHHIPDYIAVISELVDELGEGSAFYSVQDPMWYPDRSVFNMLAYRACFGLWRIFQGNTRRGAQTVWRRMRRVYDQSSPSDMVEYHVVRSGVNEGAIQDVLNKRFESVAVWLYWSTQSATLQVVGDRLGWKSTFGIIGTGRRAKGSA